MTIQFQLEREGLGVWVVTKKSKETETSDDSPRVIKKYPNRRLYDTLTSSYITLAEVKKMVMDQVQIMVVDAKNQMDLTRSILLQIILEQEAEGSPMFSQKALENMIRFYGHALQGYMGTYLERNVQTFVEMQKKIADNSLANTPESWMQLMSPFMKGSNTNLTDESSRLFTQMHEAMQTHLKQQTDQMLSVMGVKPKEQS